jgi:N-acetylmuramoyl-L-alanine amidase CwlA
MALDIENHPSPNHNSRGGVKVRAIVMHATAGTNSLSHLLNPAPGGNRENAVSAHDLISKTGKIFHLVDYDKRAWHAGKASIPPFTADVNSLSIGIEIENKNNGQDPYPEAQVAAAVELVQKLTKEFGITRQFVVTHKACALPPGRKNDPRGFDMEKFLDRVFGEREEGVTTLVVVGDGLRIRKEAKTDSDIVDKLRAGEKIRVDRIVAGEEIEGENQWAHLEDGRGFVTMRFLRAA